MGETGLLAVCGEIEMLRRAKEELNEVRWLTQLPRGARLALPRQIASLLIELAGHCLQNRAHPLVNQTLG